VPELSEVLGRMSGTPSLPQPLELSAALFRPQRITLSVPPETNASSTKAGERDYRERFSALAALPIVGALMLIGVLAYYSRTTEAPADLAPLHTDSTPAPTNAGAVLSASAEQEYVELRISIKPPDADVFVDDQRLLPTSRLVRDGRVHRIRAEALGYSQHAQLVAFDSHVIDVSFALEPINNGRWQAAPLRPARGRLAPAKSTQKEEPPPSTAAAIEGPSLSPARATSTAAATPPSTDSTNKPPLDPSDPWKK
jgi:hypothetical protein